MAKPDSFGLSEYYYAHPTSIDFSFKEFSYVRLPKVRLRNSNDSSSGSLWSPGWSCVEKSASNKVLFYLDTYQRNTDLPRQYSMYSCTIITLHGDRIYLQTYYMATKAIFVFIILQFSPQTTYGRCNVAGLAIRGPRAHSVRHNLLEHSGSAKQTAWICAGSTIHKPRGV